jgi:hypothetical protein
MNRRSLAVAALAGLLVAMPCVVSAVDGVAGKERIGARAGGIATFDGLNDAYGGGWDLTLFFQERFAEPLYLDVRIGAIYLGDLLFEELDDELLRTDGIQASMRLLYITAGLVYGRPLGGGYAGYVGAGAGIYSVSMLFDALNTPNISDQKFGFNGGVGMSRRLTTNWSLDANAFVHYFMVEQNIEDVYYAFTDGADAPLLLDISVGIIVDLR